MSCRQICPGLAAILLVTVFALAERWAWAAELERVPYRHPGLIVDLGVGLWAFPLPMDFDGDGDLDLVVSCPDKPYNGLYFFENATGKTKFPIFKPAKRISAGLTNVSPSYVDHDVRVLAPAAEFFDIRGTGFGKPTKLPLAPNIHPNKVRHNQWKYVDFDGDGVLDLIVGAEDWTDYGWDDAFDKTGHWTRGPLRGFIYWLRNTGSSKSPKYDSEKLIRVADKPLEVFGLPSPNFADWDHDGDLDLICGEFLDGFTYFENIGSRTQPVYAAGRRLQFAGQPLAMELEMIVPVAIDWDEDGDLDLVVGDEDGRVALIENTGKLADRAPQFLPPRYFQQEADDLKFGALATPCGVDWDGDGDIDIVSGNSAGYIGFFENLSGPGVEQPKWAAPRRLEADGKVIRYQAGPNGSIQGPAEAKWGYTTLNVADWDGDGLPDILVNSIWGRVEWFRNIGTRTAPKLAAAQSIEVAWPGKTPKPEWVWWEPHGKELVTQWRTTPLAVDFNRDGLTDLVMLDQEGFLAFFERQRRDGTLLLLPPRSAFIDQDGKPLQLNTNRAGKSGRRKMCITDWDGDGRLDVLINGTNVNWLRQTEARGNRWVLQDQGKLDSRVLAGHDTSPTVVDWNGDGKPDLLVGAEDGRMYYKRSEW